MGKSRSVHETVDGTVDGTVVETRVPTRRGAFSLSPVRRLVLALGLAVAGLAVLSPTARADVSISPAQAEQGSAVSVTFQVSNDRPGTHTTAVEILLPTDTPVAEVYAMTVPDWAPKTLYRKVDQPLTGIHGTGLTTVTSSVIWTRVAGGTTPPPAVENLRLEMGPMPEAASYTFTVVQTYSDGTVKRWQGPASSGSGPGTVMTLTPPAAGQDAAAAHQHGSSAQPSAGTSSAAGADHAHGQPQTGSGKVSVDYGVSGATEQAVQGGGSFLEPMLLGAGGTLLLGVVGMLLLAARSARTASDAAASAGAAAASGAVQASDSEDQVHRQEVAASAVTPGSTFDRR